MTHELLLGPSSGQGKMAEYNGPNGLGDLCAVACGKQLILANQEHNSKRQFT